MKDQFGKDMVSKAKKGKKKSHKTITVSILTPINAGIDKKNFLQILESKIYN